MTNEWCCLFNPRKRSCTGRTRSASNEPRYLKFTSTTTIRSVQIRDNNTTDGMPPKNSPSHTYYAGHSKLDSATATAVAQKHHKIVSINRKDLDGCRRTTSARGTRLFESFAAVRTDSDLLSTLALIAFVAARSQVGLARLIDLT